MTHKDLKKHLWITSHLLKENALVFIDVFIVYEPQYKNKTLTLKEVHCVLEPYEKQGIFSLVKKELVRNKEDYIDDHKSIKRTLFILRKQ